MPTDVQNLNAAITNWRTQLVQDSLGTLGAADYNIDGQMVSASAWRDSINRSIAHAYVQINQLQPFYMPIRQVM